MYGEPDLTDKLRAEADAGRVHFGGCVVSGLGDDPNRHCNECATQWNTKTPDKLLGIDEELITVILPTINNGQ